MEVGSLGMEFIFLVVIEYVTIDEITVIKLSFY